MTVILNIAVMFAAYVAMEAVAWFAHKYLMHGLLWYLHRDHHHRDNEGVLEKNDYFFLIFALPGIAAIIAGIGQGYNFWFYLGMGITLYGLSYFIVHDVFIHQRIKILRNTDSVYFRAIRKAHKVHHKHLNKEDGECFGMLWVPRKYFKEARKAIQKT